MGSSTDAARPRRRDRHRMSAQQHNQAVVRDCFAQASAGNYDALPGILTEDYALHPGDARGAEGLAKMVQGHRDQIPDLTVTIDQQFAEGDSVATRFTISGRHVTGRDVRFTGLTVSRCRDGRIAEEWELVDVMSLLAQIGQLPEAGAR
jgi:predicted ester cyclase